MRFNSRSAHTGLLHSPLGNLPQIQPTCLPGYCLSHRPWHCKQAGGPLCTLWEGFAAYWGPVAIRRRTSCSWLQDMVNSANLKRPNSQGASRHARNASRRFANHAVLIVLRVLADSPEKIARLISEAQAERETHRPIPTRCICADCST